MAIEKEASNGRGTLGERLSTLEFQVSSLAGQIGSLASEVRASREGHKTNWQTLAAWAGVILVIGGFAGNLIFSTLTDKIAIVQKASENSEALSHTRHEGQAELIRIANDRIGMLRAEYDASNSKHVANFKEVETQLRSLSNRANLGFETHDRLIGDLWQLNHKRELPPARVYPVIGDALGASP